MLKIRSRLTQSSMYRNLADLENEGVVRRVSGSDSVLLYELDEVLIGHHHYLVCMKCGQVDDFVVPDSTEARSNSRLGVTFDAVLTAQDIGSYKPDVRNFRVLLEKARTISIGIEQHLHVAQILFHDHVPAQSVGLRTLWINRYGAKRAAAGSLGATPAATPVTPHWEFPTLRSLADAMLTTA